MENEKEIFLGVLNDQVSKPLRALITGAPLEDARHLTHRYDKLRQDVEAQAAEALRRRSKTRDSEISAESFMKLQAAEARLTELKSTMMALGREAAAAMSSVENQQQEITAQRLFSMVDAERCYHQHVLTILDKLHAEVIHPFDAQAEGELSLFIDDFVVVRQVAPTGWSEGECKGKAGWFPSAYIEKHETAPASKIMEESSPP
ncbi:SH3 domain-containing protein 2-like isoform X2 [Populus alba x Populus x berolinensis]|nr:SH3 domain-containing protein 2-like isoform X2 [Populus alba x Populus x berolinensis]